MASTDLSKLLPTLSSHLTPLTNYLTPLLTPLTTPPIDLLPPLLTAFGAIIVISLTMRRLFNKFTGNNSDPDATADVIFVKLGANDHLIKFPRESIEAGETTLGMLRGKVAEAAGGEVTTDRVTLLTKGKRLNTDDDAKPLRDLGVFAGARLLCMASAPSTNKPNITTPSKSPAPKKTKPLTPLETIASVRAAVEEKTGAMTKEFLSNPPPAGRAREDMHRKISETVMEELLRLDAVEGGDEEVRMKRKECVREIQGVLGKLDRVLKEGAEREQ